MKTLTTPTINFETQEFETLQAEKIVKGDDYIIGYISDKEVFSFTGITDFAGYHLAEGEEWDSVELTADQIAELERQELGRRSNYYALGIDKPPTAHSLAIDYERRWANDEHLEAAYQKGIITQDELNQIKDGNYNLIREGTEGAH